MTNNNNSQTYDNRIEQKRESEHIQHRLLATVGDTCQSRIYHIVEDLDGFTIVPNSLRQNEEWAKRWSVTQSLNCNCTQSEHVVECAHVEALRSAIADDCKPDEKCLSLAEGRLNAYDSVEWYEMVNESNGNWRTVARNHKGHTIQVSGNADNPRVKYDTGDSSYDTPLDDMTTDNKVISSFINSDRQEILRHIRDMAKKSSRKKLREARGSDWDRELVDEVVNKKDLGRSSTPDLDVGTKLYLCTRQGEYDLQTVKTIPFDGTEIKSAGRYEGGVETVLRTFCVRKYGLDDDKLQKGINLYQERVRDMLGEKE